MFLKQSHSTPGFRKTMNRTLLTFRWVLRDTRRADHFPPIDVVPPEEDGGGEATSRGYAKDSLKGTRATREDCSPAPACIQRSYHRVVASRTLSRRRRASRSVGSARSAWSTAARASLGRSCASSISPARVQTALLLGSLANPNERRKSARRESVSRPASAICSNG
jgi:hypothetical protein